nr:primosomal protein N' [Aeromonadaceae bacterium]
GLVVLQSHHPGHLLLQDLVQNGYDHFARTCLQERALLGLPPFAFQSLLRSEAVHKANVDQFMLDVAGLIMSRRSLYPGLQVIGPISALMERRAGKYRMQLLLQMPQRAPLAHLLTRILPEIETLPSGRKVRWSLDVDPQELF